MAARTARALLRSSAQITQSAPSTSSIASTSSSWLTQSYSAAPSKPASRTFASSALSLSSHERTQTPARDHRGKPSQSEDPLTGEPRNSSAQHRQEQATESQDVIGDVAAGNQGPSAEMGVSGRPTPPGVHPSDVSTADARTSFAADAAATMTQSVTPPAPAAAAAVTGMPTAGYSQDALGYTPITLPTQKDETIEAFVCHLMRHGKKAMANRQVLGMMRHLAAALNTDPLPALRHAIDLASPMVRVRTNVQGAKNIQHPVALNPQQMRRRGLVNIIQASKKKSDREIEKRLAKEILGVLDGNSEALRKKEEVHKDAVRVRANFTAR